MNCVVLISDFVVIKPRYCSVVEWWFLFNKRYQKSQMMTNGLWTNHSAPINSRAKFQRFFKDEEFFFLFNCFVLINKWSTTNLGNGQRNYSLPVKIQGRYLIQMNFYNEYLCKQNKPTNIQYHFFGRSIAWYCSALCMSTWPYLTCFFCPDMEYFWTVWLREDVLHLEQLNHSLTTDSFVAAFRQFTSQKCMPVVVSGH